MDCATCHDHFTDILEGTNSPEAVAGQQHLSQCPACAELHAAFARTVADIRALPVVAPPPGLLRSIGDALDEVEPARAVWQTYWQPLTAGVAVAACVMLVTWTLLVSPVSVADAPLSSSPSVFAPPTQRAAAPPLTSAPMGVRPNRAIGPGPTSPVMSGRPQGGPRQLVARGPQSSGQQGRAPDFGSWGSQIVLAPAAGGGAAGPTGGGKPAGTFAAGDDSGDASQPLNRTSGEVQLTFVPPVERIVGKAVTGQLVVTGEAEAEVVVKVTPRAGLRVLTRERGVLYRGPMRKGEKLELPLTVLALQPGDRGLSLSLEGDVAGVAADLDMTIPGFAGKAMSAGDVNVTLVFRDTPDSRALRELAAAVGGRVVLHEGVGGQLVTQDYGAGIPLAAALKILCDSCGYRLAERSGVYHIYAK